MLFRSSGYTKLLFLVPRCSPEGSILDAFVAVNENWREIRKMIPSELDLGQGIFFAEGVWTVIEPGVGFIPLRIAQKPVVVRPPYACGPVPYIPTGVSDPPTDPMPNHVLDPHRYLQPTVLVEMLQHLPAEVYYVAFLTNGDLIVLLSKPMHDKVLRFPRTLCQRVVNYVYSAFLVPSSGSSAPPTPMHHHTACTVGDQAPSSAPSDHCFRPGETLYWKGRNYKSGVIPTKDITTQIIPFSAGLVVNYLNRGLFLTIPTHGYMIPNSLAQKKKSIKSFFELSPTKGTLHYALDGLPEVRNT